MPQLFIRKNTVYGNFHKNLRKNILTLFVRHFLTNQAKIEDEDEKKLESEFDLWVLHIKIRLYANFHENLRLFWDEDGKKVVAKNEDEDKKMWENEFYFWTLHMKIELYDNFHENLRKKS